MSKKLSQFVPFVYPFHFSTRRTGVYRSESGVPFEFRPVEVLEDVGSDAVDE